MTKSELMAGLSMMPAINGVRRVATALFGLDTRIASLESRATVLETPSYSFTTSGAPTGTASVHPTFKMMGLALALTPSRSKVVMVHIAGRMFNNTGTVGNGGVVQVAYGTGTAPTNGATATGTNIGLDSAFSLDAASANQGHPFSILAVVSGLVAGTPYWFDLKQAALVAGTFSVQNLNCLVCELS